MRALHRAIQVLLLAALMSTTVVAGLANAQQCPPNCPIQKPPAVPEPPELPTGK